MILGGFTKFVAVVTRTLQEGKIFGDDRHAWFHSNGFGVLTATTQRSIA